ncbi:hypothetical protein FYK55_01250 [Roseiconus nitratireducens]|uniref:Uncharacterized protein n=1 Tax=Roseiconus nitratireducens TaxID=2605748 RepID=A0A5M6DHQ3_9BACT|nr:hypothetical protein [Roseiconus nitratireducens]KAA5547074.1 hypothetical protein FYK55_01250 [Roseiconus nitratireducens]
MNDPFLEAQWNELVEKVRQTASMDDGGDQAGRLRDAEEFAQLPVPERYDAYLERVRESAALANRWRESRVEHDASHDDALVDEVGDESFPASDPPPFSHSHA